MPLPLTTEQTKTLGFLLALMERMPPFELLIIKQINDGVTVYQTWDKNDQQLSWPTAWDALRYVTEHFALFATER